MKIWIGHYRKNPKEWFIVWANSKDDAFRLLDGTSGEPDMDSFKEVKKFGFVDFQVILDDSGGLEMVEYELSDLVVEDEAVEEYVRIVLKRTEMLR